MTAFIRLLARVSNDLEEIGVPWALIGALAVSSYGEARSTRDVDIAVTHSDSGNQESLMSQLIERGYQDRCLLMHAEPTQRLGDRLSLIDSQGAALAIDFLFSSSGIEREIVSRAVPVELLPGVKLPVASRADLIAMKVLSRNSHDRIRDDLDLQVLLRDASASELEAAKEACGLITQRGFNRHKDLMAELSQTVERFWGHRATGPG